MNPFSFFSPLCLLMFYVWTFLLIKEGGKLYNQSELINYNLSFGLKPQPTNRYESTPIYFKQGWYGLQHQAGPILYSSTPNLILRYKNCFSSSFKLYEGDLITLLSWSKDVCTYKRSQLPAPIRLSFNLALNLNSATLEELSMIRGLGYKKAKQIVQNRPYVMMRHLLKLKGVGLKTLRKWRPFLSITSPRHLGPFPKITLNSGEERD